MLIKGKQFVRRIIGEYFQDRDGKWWLFNHQHGWIQIDGKGRAFLWYLLADTKERLTLASLARSTGDRCWLGLAKGKVTP